MSSRWPQEIADAARAILAQYNAAEYGSYRFRGPHYVTWERGEFMMRPYGVYPNSRYSFLVRPGYQFGVLDTPFWIFNVL